MSAAPTGSEIVDFPQMSTTSGVATSEPSALQRRARTSSGGGRRRRIPDSITTNACSNCKKARAKCDGAKPCKRCTAREAPDECRYEVHVKTAKEDMLREIQRLQKRNETLEDEKDTLEEKLDWIERIVRALKEDAHGTEIIQRLKYGETHQAIAEWLGRPMIDDINNLSPTSELKLAQELEDYHMDLIENRDPRFWTNVTTNVGLIEHLVGLYLTWIHPVHMLFDEGKFVTSFRDCKDVYCSSSLVNAICGMSCHLLHKSWDNDEDIRAAIETLSSRFMNEARALMKEADEDKMTVLQTYAVMFLFELGSGKGRVAGTYLRLATEILVAKKQTEQSRESEEVSTWGVFTLHTAWSGFCFEKPSTPISPHATVFRNVDLDLEDVPWTFYRQPEDFAVSSRPSHGILIASEHAKLFRIIHETILVYCTTGEKLAANKLSDLYCRYLKWEEDLPHVVRNIDEDSNAVPHALYLHIQYHTALVNLFQPLLHLNEHHQSSYDCLRNLVIHHSRQALVYLSRYKQMYTFVYQSPLQLFCIVHICDALVRYSPTDDMTSDIVSFCLESLQEAKTSYCIAGHLQKMFRLALARTRTPFPDDLEKLMGSSSRYGPEELLEAVSRISYRPPIEQLLPNMEPKLGQDFVREWQKRADEQPIARSHLEPKEDNNKRMQINSLLNSNSD